MKKYNFILSENTVPQFIHLFNKMLKRTCALQSQSIYTGKKAIKSMLKEYGIKTIGIVPVDKTRIGYIHASKTANNWRVDTLMRGKCLLMNDSTDSCLIIPFGKMYIADSFIRFKGIFKITSFDEGNGYTTTISICGNPDKVLSRVRESEKYAREYSADSDYEREYDIFDNYEHFKE